MSPRHFHFIGICGTAMGAMAAALKDRGYTVSGTDERVYPPMSTFLENAGVPVTEGFHPDHIPENADVIVVGNAISRGNAEIESVLNRRLRYVSMPEAMKEYFLGGKRNFVVTGTHGKTTTASLLSWLFVNAGRDPGWFIGGIPANLGKGCRLNDTAINVLEGDEYDTAFFDKRSKFMHYLPEVVIINNIEYDHADIYANIEEIKLTFRRLMMIVPGIGTVFANGDDLNCREVAAACPAPVCFVGLGDTCDKQIKITERTTSGTGFTLDGHDWFLPMTGEFNVRNAAMAICAARFGGLQPEEIQSGLSSFLGVARRQQVRGVRRGVTIIDDFGHHPTAIRETIQGMRQRFPGSKLWALFEPRSNTSRRNVYQKEFAEALALADGSVIAGVENPGKVPENERLDPMKVASEITANGGKGWCEPNADAVIARIQPFVHEGDVVIVFSNGGFDNIHEKLLQQL